MPDLADGESAAIQGSARLPYMLKNTGGVYSCTCPAWRNQSIAIERRTCKHLRAYRGAEAEARRVGDGAVACTQPKSTSEGEAASPPLLLAQSWENDVDLNGWWLSEKLDGVRAYWDGKQFLSRQGNLFHAPDWFAAGLPSEPLDGELWLGRKSFQRAVSIVRRQDKSDLWRDIRYLVFDMPAIAAPFEERMARLADCLASRRPAFATPHEQQPCRGIDHLRGELARVESLGGEGLMLRQPGSKYEAGRSSTLLKVKTFHDAEATVVGHVPGAGRHRGRLGALAVELSNGTSFSVGTGFSDRERDNPPPIGSVVTFRYQELSDGGVPRFPSYLGVRHGATGEGELPPAAPRATGSSSLRASSQGAAPKDTTLPSKKAVAKPAMPSSGSSASGKPRYFEFTDGSSSKFWEVALNGSSYSVRFGRIGAQGQTKVKEFADAATARSEYEKLVQEKIEKGYKEPGAS